MFFGDYLLRQNLIDQEDLIEALTLQLSSTPPLLKVLRDSRSLETAQLLDVVKIQVESGQEIRSILLKRGYMQESDLQRVLHLQNRHRQPLGQILIEMGKLDVEQCQEALSSYLHEKQGLSLTDGELDLDSLDEEELIRQIEQEKAEKSMVTEETEEDRKEFSLYLQRDNSGEPRVASSNAGRVELEFVDIEDFVLSEYLEVFDEMKRDDLDQTILSWKSLVQKSRANELKENFRLFYRELHTLKGTVRFLRGVASEHLIHTGEDLLADWIVASEQIDLAIVDQIEVYYLLLSDLIWRLREALAQRGQEKSLWESADFQEKLVQFHRQSDNLKLVVEEILASRSAEDVVSQF